MPPSMQVVSTETELQSLFANAHAASQAGLSDEAIRGWKECLRRLPHFPQAHAMLGAEFAHTGRLGDAVLHMSMAVEQDATLATARLLLGLLWLTLNAPLRAVRELDPLLQNPSAADSLYHFAEGLTALAGNDLVHTERHLVRGLSLPQENAPLKADMERVLASVRLRAPIASAEPRVSTAAEHGLAISAYTGTAH